MTLIVGGTVTTAARDARSLLLARPVESLLVEQHNIFRQEEKAANIFKMVCVVCVCVCACVFVYVFVRACVVWSVCVCVCVWCLGV